MSCIPAAFALHHPEPELVQDARFDESLLALAMRDGPTACIWQTARSLVVPRSYRRFEAFEAACHRFSDMGWPVTVRQTGGGIVPQGPGIVNLSLAYRVSGMPMRHSEAGYQLICRVLAQALNDMGLKSFPAPVEGSFCDGRYNLAVRLRDAVVKIAGTAQMWRRMPGTPDSHIGLIHALVLIDTDTEILTDTANAFEAAIGSERCYLVDRVRSAGELLGFPQGLSEQFQASLARALTELPQAG